MDAEPDRSARPEASRGIAGIGVLLVMTLVALGVLRIAPVVVYRCAPGETGARCTVSWRYAGLVELERKDVDGIREAASSTWSQSSSSSDGQGRSSTSTESMSKLQLNDAGGKPLFEDTQSGAVGADVRDIADAVNARVASVAKDPFMRFQAPWLPNLFASLFLLIAVPSLLDSLRRRWLPPRRGSAVLWIEFLVVAVPLAIGWFVLLSGELPWA
jgi:hypothetical protein